MEMQVIPHQLQEIAALTRPIEEVEHAIAVNLGQMQLSPFDFARITIPTGGGTQWSLQTLEGDKMEAEIQGIIVVAQDARSYFKLPFGAEERRPPDCSSRDGVTGIGNPGGECAKCPLNQWDTKPGPTGLTRGKACREGKQLFLVRGNEILPELLQLPPTSLKACRQYLLRLTGSGYPYYGVVTAITLERTKSGGGVAYSEARFRFLRRLSNDEIGKLERLHGLCASLMQRVIPVIPEDQGSEQ
jgi:hypothetical protein